MQLSHMAGTQDVQTQRKETHLQRMSEATVRMSLHVHTVCKATVFRMRRTKRGSIWGIEPSKPKC